MISLISKVSETMLMEKADLLEFALSAPHRYKKYYILKRGGAGYRLIAQPSKQTKFVQRIVLDELKKILPVHRAAMAYEKGTGIKLNAMHHQGNRYLLKMDFRDFFPSITPGLFSQCLQKCDIELSKEDLLFLQRLLFWRPKRKDSLRLSIGAPSSPFISNFVMIKFDEIISNYCAENGINYTRYADDITFTTNTQKILFDVPNIVRQTLEKEYKNTIFVKEEKTIFSSKAFNRHVTGIVITNNGTLSLGREKKRIISSMIHQFSHGRHDDEFRQKLKGLLAFSLHIEHDFIKRMKQKYSADVIDLIML